jgi:hypothetical protein
LSQFRQIEGVNPMRYLVSFAAAAALIAASVLAGVGGPVWP